MKKSNFQQQKEHSSPKFNSFLSALDKIDPIKYHNTELLLKNYRDIVWELSIVPSEIAEELDTTINDLDALLSKIDFAVSMCDAKLDSRLTSVLKSRLLLDRINEAITILKKKPRYSPLLYKIIYETYISPEWLPHLELIDKIRISTRHYYRLRKEAINIISLRLWSAPSNALGVWFDILTRFGIEDFKH